MQWNFHFFFTISVFCCFFLTVIDHLFRGFLAGFHGPYARGSPLQKVGRTLSHFGHFIAGVSRLIFILVGSTPEKKGRHVVGFCRAKCLRFIVQSGAPELCDPPFWHGLNFYIFISGIVVRTDHGRQNMSSCPWGKSAFQWKILPILLAHPASPGSCWRRNRLHETLYTVAPSGSAEAMTWAFFLPCSFLFWVAPDGYESKGKKWKGRGSRQEATGDIESCGWTHRWRKTSFLNHRRRPRLLKFKAREPVSADWTLHMLRTCELYGKKWVARLKSYKYHRKHFSTIKFSTH